MMLVPRSMSFSSALGDGKTGAAWKNPYGFVGVNAAGLAYATDGMNEAGLTVGALFFPGFAQYQEVKADELATTVSNVDLVNYILSNFKTVDEVRQAMPKIRVVRNAEIEKEFGTPLPLHHIVSDATGASIVIEYMDGQLSVTDNKVGAMTNSPGYDWHLLNLRNYANLTPQAARPHSIDGVSLAPFGAGSGMLGLPGDFTPPSRFVRAVAFVNTMIPAKDAADAVNAASVMLNNFDIPKGLVREGAAEDFHLGYTQWSVIADMRRPLSFRRREDRPCPVRLHDRRLAEPGIAPTGHRKGFRLAAPFTQKDHLAHHIFVGQSVAAVLAARDRDLDRVRNISREPYVRPAGWRGPRPHRHSPAREADARAARAAIAPAHQAG
jgi:choloylglycine hydrolase